MDGDDVDGDDDDYDDGLIMVSAMASYGHPTPYTYMRTPRAGGRMHTPFNHTSIAEALGTQIVRPSCTP